MEHMLREYTHSTEIYNLFPEFFPFKEQRKTSLYVTAVMVSQYQSAKRYKVTRVLHLDTLQSNQSYKSTQK